MTKQEEIDLFRKFVGNLPKESYLFSMFGNAPDMVERMIRNDFAYDPLPEIERRQREAQADLAAILHNTEMVKKTLEYTEKRIRDLGREENRVQEGIKKLKEEARRLVRSLE